MPATALLRWPWKSRHCLRSRHIRRLRQSGAGKPICAETADSWNERIESWTYVTGTALCAEVGVSGYYVRIAPPDTADAASPKDGYVPIKNRPPGDADRPAEAIVSPDALALVRFGLRAADDPRIVDTVKVIDAQLRRNLPQGPLWYRYTDDGYGEHEDGAPFDGTGQGRPWPLLAGERAHYELAAGNRGMAESLLKTLEASAEPGGAAAGTGWDGPDMPERELRLGGPTGSRHAAGLERDSEHIKLLRSLRDGTVSDMPPQGVKRYIQDKIVSPLRTWRFNNKLRTIPSGKLLRIELPARAVIRWSIDGWTSSSPKATRLKTPSVSIWRTFRSHVGRSRDQRHFFTFHWLDADCWENVDFSVGIEA